MPLRHTLAALALAATSSLLWAQPAAPSVPAEATATAPTPTAYVPRPWTYKTQQLNRAQVDALVGQPKKVLFLDLRRPDELVRYGSFPVYLNVQLKDLPQVLDFIPRDRTIVTVSNRAHRAGDAGDLLSAKGFKVAGAIGSEDYREAGGTIVKVEPRAPATAPAAPAK